MQMRVTKFPANRRQCAEREHRPAGWLRAFLAVLAVAGLAAVSSAPVVAQDYVITKGKLSDRDFYRLIACAAPPGGQCQKPALKWPASKANRLTIGLIRIDEGFPQRNVGGVQAALANTIQQINSVGAGVRLLQISSGKPDISIVLSPTLENLSGRKSSKFSDLIDSFAATAMARVFTKPNSATIQRAEVVITGKVPRSDLKSVVLEEVVQSLGLMTDIHNKYYNRRSIFSEVGSRVTRLKGQDAKAVLFHYPP